MTDIRVQPRNTVQAVAEAITGQLFPRRALPLMLISLLLALLVWAGVSAVNVASASASGKEEDSLLGSPLGSEPSEATPAAALAGPAAIVAPIVGDLRPPAAGNSAVESLGQSSVPSEGTQIMGQATDLLIPLSNLAHTGTLKESVGIAGGTRDPFDATNVLIPEISPAIQTVTDIAGPLTGLTMDVVGVTIGVVETVDPAATVSSLTEPVTDEVLSLVIDTVLPVVTDTAFPVVTDTILPVIMDTVLPVVTDTTDVVSNSVSTGTGEVAGLSQASFEIANSVTGAVAPDISHPLSTQNMPVLDVLAPAAPVASISRAPSPPSLGLGRTVTGDGPRLMEPVGEPARPSNSGEWPVVPVAGAAFSFSASTLSPSQGSSLAPFALTAVMSALGLTAWRAMTIAGLPLTPGIVLSSAVPPG